MSFEIRPSLVVITNLYPTPWDPNRATFNRQQFDLLRGDYDLSILVPLPFPEWIRHRREIVSNGRVRYAPYFYVPKVGRRFYSYFMFMSVMLHSFGWIKKRRPARLLATWAYPDAVCASWIARILRVPFYFKIHGSDINVHAGHASRARQIRAAANAAKCVISVSEALAERARLIGIPSEKIAVIYNGVDHEKFGSRRPSPHHRSYILFVGNLKREKGVLELLEGFAVISEDYPQLDLIYVGEGVMRDIILQLAVDRGVSDRVRLVGAVNHRDVPAWIGNSLFLALPSYREGLPNVILESLACGRPVLASEVGGIPEVINNSELGVLVSVVEANSISEAIRIMLETNWSEDRIRSYAERFSWEKNKARLLEVLAA